MEKAGLRKNNVDNILKFLYYLVGIQIAVFGFVVSKLIEIDYSVYNYFLIGTLFFLMMSIGIVLSFIVINVFRPNEQIISNKKTRYIMSCLGPIFGLSMFGIICWLLLFKGYIIL